MAEVMARDQRCAGKRGPVSYDNWKTTEPDDRIPRPTGCRCHWEIGDSPCPVHGDSEGDATDESHTCVYVGVDGHDECEICSRRADQFADLPDHMRPDWDGRAL